MYSRHMNGESLSVHLTMRRTPPNSTMPIHTATTSPNTKRVLEARDGLELRIGLADLEDRQRAAHRRHAEESREKLAETRHADAAERHGYVVHRAAGDRAVRRAPGGISRPA